LRRLGRSLQLWDEPQTKVVELRTRHSREVRRLHQRLFYRPLLSAVARLSPAEARLTPDAARARLSALGYRDPAGALRHIEVLTEGMSRPAANQRHLLPDMLGLVAAKAEPVADQIAFRACSERLGPTDS